jgi:hypothetical protein
MISVPRGLGEPPVLPDAQMRRVIQKMQQTSYGEALDFSGVADAARPLRAPSP